ncbi:flagellar hook-associated family protein [Aureimonas glaciei]|uniref:Flagellin n=1 Tax=Aureimonas glaciei TaxID=1776957 RepID=A0A917DD43_9HYPH|nr:flagellar hook-associated family protein [Aureimonas glaciei]GGD27569.1 flagellin [Aureimonas glaciei]
MSISTLSFNTSTRVSLQRLQSQVNDATQELNSGRHLDIGKTLGRLTGSAVSARAQENSFKEQQASNGLVITRLKNIDASLATISEGAESLANNLIGVSVATNFDTLINEAKSGLQTMTGALNATGDGQYLFGGDNTDAAPITTTASAARATRLASEFNAFVLAATGGTDASQVSGTDMADYLGGGSVKGGVTYKFSDEFQAASWTAASSGTIDSRISKTETVTSSLSANNSAFSNIAEAYTMIASLGIDTLNADARKAVTDKATLLLKGGGDQATTLRADVGTKLKRIDGANAELQRQQDIMAATVSGLEEVDITEVSLRVNALSTQLQAAYSVTGKIQGLSILDYI